MKVWHFSETAYHPAWSQLGVYRVVIPSRLYDPKIGADLYHRNLDESRDGRNIDPRTMTVEDAIDAGLVFAGTPDDVFAQLHAFHAHVGGFGHLLMMGQGALLDHNETVANLTLFSKEVLPRVENLSVM